MSVVTATLNAANELAPTLESILAQTHQNIELIVVDGCSWDGTQAVLRRYADKIDVLSVQPDAGIYYAMNAAVELTSRDFVLFLNAGDVFNSADAISRIMTSVEGNSDVVYGDHVYTNGHIELLKRSARFEQIAAQLFEGEIDVEWLETIPCHQATFVRKALLVDLRFDTRLLVSADHDLLLRAHDVGAKMQYVDEIVCRYRGGGFSVAMGERTKLEGASIYRRFSAYPERVDKFFFPGVRSPFDPQTYLTGLRLAGFRQAGPADVDAGTHRISTAGARIMSPARPCRRLDITGINATPDQALSVLLENDVVGTSRIPATEFRMQINLDRTVPGDSIITLAPRADDLAIRSFSFHENAAPPSWHVSPESPLYFRTSSAAVIAEILGEGWSQPEETHTWSLGTRSELWLKASATTRFLRCIMTGNPHTPDGRQTVSLLVNDVPIATATCERGGALEFEIDCTTSPWLSAQINQIVLKPQPPAPPPPETGDARMLGVCLREIRCF
ncbi:MAG: glycosyltransferase family 2 protein [Candidatus Sphingomonas phytovorans]|nr:glycosyltransferase family 2 protein [Sphingomonas sp.]WEJ99493.1 MAG: glycosyltransferase family 2 protein [Sphingomonas sp.]